MVQDINYEILTAIADNVLEELYTEVQKFPEMMVCDWRAYAILESYRQYSYLLENTIIPEIEDCFSGRAVPPNVRLSKTWTILTELHILHWNRYASGKDVDLYESLLNQDRLSLKDYTLYL